MIRKKVELQSPAFKDVWIKLPSHLMLEYTLPSSLIQNILENISLPSPKRSLNYIPLLSYLKIYTLLPQYFYFISNNLATKKKINLTVHFEKNSIACLF